MNNGSKVANFRHFLCMNFRTQHNAWKFNQKPPLWAVLCILVVQPVQFASRFD